MSDPSLRQLRLTDAELTLNTYVVEAKEDLFRRLRSTDTSHESLLIIKGEALALGKLQDRIGSAQKVTGR